MPGSSSAAVSAPRSPDGSFESDASTASSATTSTSTVVDGGDASDDTSNDIDSEFASVVDEADHLEIHVQDNDLGDDGVPELEDVGPDPVDFADDVPELEDVGPDPVRAAAEVAPVADLVFEHQVPQEVPNIVVPPVDPPRIVIPPAPVPHLDDHMADVASTAFPSVVPRYGPEVNLVWPDDAFENTTPVTRLRAFRESIPPARMVDRVRRRLEDHEYEQQELYEAKVTQG